MGYAFARGAYNAYAMQIILDGGSTGTLFQYHTISWFISR